MSETTPRVRTIRYPGPLALFLIWTAVAAVSYGRHYLCTAEAGTAGILTRIWPECLQWLTCFYPWIGLAPLVFLIERRCPLEAPAWRRNLVMLVLAGAATSYIAAMVSGAAALAAGRILAYQFWTPQVLWAPPAAEMAFEMTVFACTVAVSFLIRRFIHLQEQEAKNAQLALEKSRLETSLKEAELEALRMRLNPHFLFNTLQNISVLTRQDPKTASQMLARLGDLLRIALKRDPRHEISLEEEIAITESYLAVEKMRFRGCLSIRFDVAPGVERALVPSLLVQPLVENAITHGLNGRAGGNIAIRAGRQGGQLVLTVTDDGSGPPEDDLEMGTGLGATSERLARLYPGCHELSVSRTPAGGTEVRVVLPFRASAAAVSSTLEERLVDVPSN